MVMINLEYCYAVQFILFKSSFRNFSEALEWLGQLSPQSLTNHQTKQPYPCYYLTGLNLEAKTGWKRLL